MQPFQQRVIQEKAELDDKLSALTAFSHTTGWKDLPIAEHIRLHRQAEAMQEYSLVLGERIAAF